MSAIMLMAAVVATVAACAAPGDPTATSPTSAPLAGDWVLAEGIDVVDGYPVTLAIDGPTAGGRSACNSHGARAVLNGSAVRFDQVSSTDMGCAPAVMDVEAAVSVLGDGFTAQVDGDVLTVTTRPGNRWEKEGRRGGKLLFSESISEYRNQDGVLCVTATMVGVQTEKAVEQ